MKNHPGRGFILLLLTIALLFAFQSVKLPSIGNWSPRQINLLSDLEKPDSTNELDSVLASIPLTIPVQDSSVIPPPAGVEPIHDYSDTTQRGMSPLFEVLSDGTYHQRPVRIAYFGDSFIEGDIFTADLRALLQDCFGGCGAGYTDIANPFAGFRNSIYLYHKGWDTRHALMGDSCEHWRLSPTLRYAMPKGHASALLKGSNRYEHANHFEKALLYLKSDHPLQVLATANDTLRQQFTTKGDGSIEELALTASMRRVQWQLEGDSTVTCFGSALEGRNGIVLDNYSFRGSSGSKLTLLSQRNWNEWGQIRPYDLIVLHFGLNVASKNQIQYDYYVTTMSRVIQRLKKAYPKAGFLIVSVSDREDRIDGELRTLPGIKALVKYQQLLASKNHIAFWNLYQAMGGEGSIVEMANEKPHGAQKDYTHITRNGGRQLARLLRDAISYEFEKYQKKRQDAK